jgi:hypothetical protein
MTRVSATGAERACCVRTVRGPDHAGAKLDAVRDGPIRTADGLLRGGLGDSVVREEVLVERGDRIVLVAEVLHKVWWGRLPRPEQEARAPDPDGR